MSAATLALAAAVDLVIAGVLFAVARAFRRQHEARDARAALVAFQLWWAGIGFTVLVNGLKEGMTALGVQDDAWGVALLNAASFAFVAATCVAVAGLLYYLLFLYTGRRAWLAPLTAFYAGYGAIALFLVWRMRPAGVTPGDWFVQWNYARPDAAGPWLGVLVLLLLLPQIAAAVAYLGLRSSARDAPTRARVQRVGWALTLWLGVTLAAPFLQLGRFAWWQEGGRLVGLAAALVILAAYRAASSGHAPSQLVEWEGEERRARSVAFAAELHERVRDLV